MNLLDYQNRLKEQQDSQLKQHEELNEQIEDIHRQAKELEQQHEELAKQADASSEEPEEEVPESPPPDANKPQRTSYDMNMQTDDVDFDEIVGGDAPRDDPPQLPDQHAQNHRPEPFDRVAN